jgi:hypothetical protein
MQFDTHGNGHGLNDLYVLPENQAESDAAISYLRDHDICYTWDISDNEGQTWCGERFLSIPFGEPHREAIERMAIFSTNKQAADELELYITSSDKRTLAVADFAFRHVAAAVDRAARALAKIRADWHDDPSGDPQGHAEFHAPASKQFPPEARAAVVVALFERCERIRQENLLNESQPKDSP